MIQGWATANGLMPERSRLLLDGAVCKKSLAGGKVAYGRYYRVMRVDACPQFAMQVG